MNGAGTSIGVWYRRDFRDEVGSGGRCLRPCSDCIQPKISVITAVPIVSHCFILQCSS